MTLIPDNAPEILKIMSNARTAHYFVVTSLTLLGYDHLISIQEEVRLMWMGSWGLFNYLYFWNRYFSFAVLVVNAARSFREIESDNVCRLFLRQDLIMSSFFITTVDLILVLRVWVLYGRKKGFLYVVLVAISAELVSMIMMGVSFMPLTKFAHLGPSLSGCYSLGPFPRVFPYYVIPALVVTFAGFVLTAYKCVLTIKWHRQVRMPIINLFLRDGAIWFLVVFSLTLSCTILRVLGRPALVELIPSPPFRHIQSLLREFC